MTKKILFICSTLLLSSCVVTNNLYVNDPVPLQKDKGTGYVGIGTGSTPKIDSVSDAGYIYFSKKMTTSVNLCAGGQWGFTDRLSGRGAIHIPNILGGFGLRLGSQYSFFDTTSIFNAAIGSDLGFVLSRDSTISLFGGEKSLNEDNHAKSALNADFFVPLSFRFSAESRIILTPRYSLNTISMKQHILDEKGGYKFKPRFASLTVGLIIKTIYAEVSIHTYENNYYPNFGLVYLFK